jgi:hypothetical protein
MTRHSVAFAFRSAATRPVKSANGPTVQGGIHAWLSGFEVADALEAFASMNREMQIYVDFI